MTACATVQTVGWMCGEAQRCTRKVTLGICSCITEFDMLRPLGTSVMQCLYKSMHWMGAWELDPQLRTQKALLLNGISASTRIATDYVRAGCTFVDFDGYKVARVQPGGLVSLVRCTFEGNTLTPFKFGAAVIEADASEAVDNSQVRLEGCTFRNTTPSSPILLADNRASSAHGVFYSDSASPTVCSFTGVDETLESSQCENSRPKPLSTSGSNFLTSSDEWFVEVQQVGCEQSWVFCLFCAMLCDRKQHIVYFFGRFSLLIPCRAS